MEDPAEASFDTELAGCDLVDERLTRPLRKVPAPLGGARADTMWSGHCAYRPRLARLVQRRHRRIASVLCEPAMY